MNHLTTLLSAAISIATLLPSNAQSIISLDGKWDLEYWEQKDTAVTDPAKVAGLPEAKVSATVPGNVELDLMAAGLVKDPEIGNNIYELRKWEGYQWMYSRHFDVPALKDGQRLVLDFEGIDCIADVWLNGKHLGHTDNAMISHCFDITGKARTGDNLVQVIISSAVQEAQKHMIGIASFRHYTESVWIRKPRHCYGWDIMPRLVSAGLWRSVNLVVKDPVSLTDVHWMTVDTDPATGHAEIFVDLQAKYPVTMVDKITVDISLSKDGKEVYHNRRLLPTFAWRTEFSIEGAELWWPKGYGDPALYDGTVTLLDDSGKVLAKDTRKVGLRTSTGTPPEGSASMSTARRYSRAERTGCRSTASTAATGNGWTAQSIWWWTSTAI